MSIILFNFAADNQTSSYMDTNQFSKIFLPRLVYEYVRGTLPFHALVDIDTWKKVFPNSGSKRDKQIRWDQIEFICTALEDRTLLFTFILPQPKNYGEVKYAAIRLKPEEHTVRRAVYYVLTKPPNNDDSWDISYLPLPLGAEKMELKFKQKIIGLTDLCNFVKNVQQIDFNDDSYNKTFLDDLRNILGDIFDIQ